MILLYITLPFALAAAGLVYYAEYVATGWDRLGYAAMAMMAGAVWAVAVLGYCVWIVVRDGWQLSSAPAIALLAVAATAGAVWGYRHYAEGAACRAQQGFYEQLAAAPAADRPELVAAHRRLIQTPSPCTADALALRFGRHVLDTDPPAMPDAERHAALALLLEAGLTPGYGLLYRFAASYADPEATRLLLERRRALNADGGDWELFPDAIVRPLLTRATAPTDDPDAPLVARSRATLRVLVEEGRPDPATLPAWMRDRLTDLGLLPAAGAAP